MFHFKRRNTFKLLSFVMMLLSCDIDAQVQFSNNLDQITSDVCTGTYKKLVVSTTNGTCSAYGGNVNAVSFVWQIESTPGVWQNIDAFAISGISYGVEQRINGAGTVISSILTVSVAYGTNEATWNYRVLAQGLGGCPVATSLNEAIAVKKNRWLGTVNSQWNDPANWSCNRVPTSSSSAIILPAVNNPVITVNANTRELTLQPGSFLTVNSGYNLTVSGAVNVQGDGNLSLLNNANLLQSSYTGSNTGQIHVFRNSSPLIRQDYTLWSSPVVGQNLQAFSPLTLSNRFYEYNGNANTYLAVNATSNDFQLGKGYLIRTPNDHPSTATIWNGQFTGVPNNGTINVSTTNGGSGQRFNAIGNPYPSPVRMSSFVSANSSRITGTLYFWRKTNSAATDPGYCTWTKAGFVSNGEAQVVNPAGILRTGQGFLVEMINTQNTVVFTNSMRIGNTNDQFFRASSETHEELTGDKFYLNILSDYGAGNQMLLGYFDEATTGVDYAIDGKELTDSDVSLTTTINAEKYLIEGRSAFQTNDVVELNFRTMNAGQFTISLGDLHGVFADQQQVFLKDKLIGITHNLKESAYVFVSESGSFTDRFEIVYVNNMLNTSEVNSQNNFVVYSDDSQFITIKSAKSQIKRVLVYDLQGRLLVDNRNQDSESVRLLINKANTVLLIEIEDSTGLKSLKKLIH